MEIESWKNIPEISISSTYVPKSEVNDSKEMENLVNENKNLKTSIHWMSNELNKLKSEKDYRNIQQTGCLEEGYGKSNLNLNFVVDTHDTDLHTHVTTLHKVVRVLKHQLTLSNKQLKKFIDRSNGLSKTVDIDVVTEKRNLLPQQMLQQLTLFEDNGMEDLLNEKDVLDQIDDSYGGTDLLESYAPHSNQNHPHAINQNNNLDEMQESGFISVEKEFEETVADQSKNKNKKTELYPSLLHNLQLQQTQTYLTQNHINEEAKAVPYNNQETMEIKPKTPPFNRDYSRKIQIYDDHKT